MVCTIMSVSYTHLDVYKRQFQNRLLLELVEKELLNRKFQVLRHHLIPPNDGGIGLGQAVYGMAYLNKKKQTDSKNVK